MPSNLHKNSNQRGTLEHVPNQNKKLTKNQQQFNRLTLKTESLKQDITDDTTRLETLLQLYNTEALPYYPRIAEQRYKLAQALAKSAERYSYNKQQLTDLSETIVELCQQVFEEVDVTKEMVEFYDKWSRQTYKEEQSELIAHAKQQFADMMYDRYGMEIDVEDIEDTTEGFEQFRRRMFQQQNEERQKFWEQHGKQAKSKRELAKEEAQKAANAMKQKSIRSVYIALAKVLHPDSEPNISLKKDKEELMKQVTFAYEQKDLQTLLRFELEWVHKTTDNIDQLTDETLKVFIDALKQQVAELEAQKLELIHSTVYANVASYASMPQNIAIGRIKQLKRELKEYALKLQQITSGVRAVDAKSYIIDFTRYYLNR